MLPLVLAAYAFSTYAGQPGIRGVTDGSVSVATFSQPSGVAVDSGGNVYVADLAACNIRKIGPDGQVTTLAGQNLLAGQTATAVPFGHVDGQGTAARFAAPQGIALDAAGNLFVADSGNGMVREVSPAGDVTTLAAGLGTPRAVAVGPQGAIYVTCSDDAIYQITANGSVSILAGQPGVEGTANGPAGSATFSQLMGIAVDGAENIYVSEGGHRDDIRKIDAREVVSTWVGSPATAGQLWDGMGADAGFPFLGVLPGSPYLASNSRGQVYLGNYDVVRQVDPDGTVTTIGGQVQGAGTTDGIGGNARFTNCAGIAVDSAGNIFVADAQTLVVRKGVPVDAASPVILVGVRTQPIASTVGAGSTFVLTAQAAGTGPIGYQWAKNGTAIAGATGPSLTLGNISPADAATYAVTVSNVAGSFAQPTGFTLSVYTPPPTAFATRHVNAGGQSLWSIAAGRGKLVAAGTGGEILVSADAGASWAPTNSGVSDWLLGVCYGDGQFAAVGDNGRILVSPDGIQWTPAASSGEGPRLNNVVFGNGVFVAVGEQGTILCSADGQTWSAEPSGVNGWLRGLTYSASGFVAAGQNGALLLSGDGVTWSPHPRSSPFTQSPTTEDIEALAPLTDNFGIFVPLYAGATGQGMALTCDYWPGPEMSLEWGAYATDATGYLRGAAAGDGTIYLAGTGGCLLVGPASSYGPWISIPSGTMADFNGAASIGNEVFLVGADETILESQPPAGSRLLNLSTLAATGSGENALTSGFSISGSGTKPMLVRASGPALAAFGVSGTLAQPVLTLFDGKGAAIGSDQGWGSGGGSTAIASAAAQVGAFPWQQGSADSALSVALAPGVYSAAVTGAGGKTGMTLLELYDGDADASSGRLVNLSSRAMVQAGAPLTAGFVIGGIQPRQVMIRALGPALSQFGIANPLARPKLAIYAAQSAQLGPQYQSQNASWSAPQQGNANEIAVDAAMSGAIPLAVGSADQVLAETLAPGSWSVQVTSADGTPGVAVVEVYDLP